MSRSFDGDVDLERWGEWRCNGGSVLVSVWVEVAAPAGPGLTPPA